jgi:hypothetical protein
LKEQLTETAPSKTQTNTTLSNSTTTTTITQNGTSPPSPSTTPLSLLSDNNDNHSNGNKLLNNNSIKRCHLDDENMDKKIKDINEMIDQSREDDDDVKDTNNHCSSSRSTPTSDKDKHHEDDDDDVNGDRCSVKSSSVNNSTVSTRTMAEKLALKDKEVRTSFWSFALELFTWHLPCFDVLMRPTRRLAPFCLRVRAEAKICENPQTTKTLSSGFGKENNLSCRPEKRFAPTPDENFLLLLVP